MAPKRKPSSAPAKENHLQLLALKPGSKVEISSNDAGFHGSWYTGTIIKRASAASRRNPGNEFLVEYTHIFQDAAGAKPLQEIINATDLRPLAPRERERKFKFGEKVDACYKNGWWEGVITEELKNGNFHVYLKWSKRQLEFGEDQLRLRREWANGSWNPPLEEDEQVEEEEVFTEKEKFSEGKTEENMCRNIRTENVKSPAIFSEGALVEMTLNEDGFQGAWFAGTIVKAVGKDRFLIEYESLRTEDDTDFLKEEINIEQIRPRPPEIAVAAGRLKMHNQVDAWYNDGWWVGVISKVLPGSKYVVDFRTSNESLTFKHSDLRLHLDWIDGKWVVAIQNDTSLTVGGSTADAMGAPENSRPKRKSKKPFWLMDFVKK